MPALVNWRQAISLRTEITGEIRKMPADGILPGRRVGDVAAIDRWPARRGGKYMLPNPDTGICQVSGVCFVFIEQRIVL